MMLWHELKSRLSLRVATAVFCAIVLVEAVILIPSAQNYERDLKVRLFEAGQATVAPLLILPKSINTQAIEASVAGDKILGIAVVDAGGSGVVRYGVLASRLAVDARLGIDNALCNDAGDHCDIAFASEKTGRKALIRLDASWIEDEKVAFVWRIAGLVLLISGFVTVVTMLIVARFVINPILKVQSKLAAARQDPEHSDSYVIEHDANDELGETVGMLNDTLRDLATTHRSAIQTRERRFQDFAEVASDWFWEMDEDLRFSYFSERLSDVTGVAQEMLLGITRVENGNPGAPEDAWQQHLDDLANHRAFRNFTHPRTKSDGTVVWLSISGRPFIDLDGKFAGFRGIGSDITLYVITEREILAAKEVAESANAAKSEFLSSMSHELLTPLNGILGFSQLLETDSRNPLSETQKRSVHYILSGGQLLLGLIDQVLDLSRIEQG
jgi:PAS domain S-box-containing protein